LKKRFGQHFLTDRGILRRIVELARIHSEDLVVEIGPGAGALTRQLAEAARRVIAIEIDRDLIAKLRADMPSNVEILHADALQVELPREPFHLVGNLPYNIATPLLKRAIEHRRFGRDVTVMIQKEVAERIRAKPRSKDYGPLSLLVQYYAIPTWGFTVPPGAFTPRPRVDSAVIRLDWRPKVPDAPDFTDFVQRAFGSRRKKLLNNLASIFPSLPRQSLAAGLTACELSPDARAEELTVEQFLAVYNRFRHE
jgi:16S rRNA (adenine1518-N6/adenine1519-N6)-dimethyltransferase